MPTNNYSKTLPADGGARVAALELALALDELVMQPFIGNSQKLCVSYTVDGAISVGGGDAFIGSSGVRTMTLALPAAGAAVIVPPIPDNSGGSVGGGQDGYSIRIVDVTGHAHTVTTPASGINGTNHILTFNGTKGSSIELEAFNGSWWVVGTASGVTIS